MQRQGHDDGRPRAFYMDKALDAALDLFWRKGYEGATIGDLTEAMGINPPSLYAAFGGKEALFLRALDRYEAMHDVSLQEALALPKVKGLYRGAAAPHRRGSDGQEQPRGVPAGAGHRRLWRACQMHQRRALRQGGPPMKKRSASG